MPKISQPKWREPEAQVLNAVQAAEGGVPQKRSIY